MRCATRMAGTGAAVRHWRVRGAVAAVLSCAVAGASASAAQARPESFVRVDQVGYESAGGKRAYLMTNVSESGARFQLRSTVGTVALTGTVGEQSGSWSRRFDHVYPLNFGSVEEPGSYTIAVDGEAPATSPVFRIGSAQALFRQPLENSLSFYQDEMDGPEYIPSALRTAPAHLNDEHAGVYLTPKVNEEGEFRQEPVATGETIDAAGGWWDAGDYLKFVQTASYATTLQLIGVRDFPAEMGSGAPGSDFSAQARFGAEWLMRMWNDETGTLYYQVGIGAGNATTISDHDIWRLPQEDDTYGGANPLYRFIRHRPVFRAGPAGSPVSPNLAGRDAAAFALCFQDFDASDPMLAGRCLHAGEHILALADTDPRRHLLTTIPFGFYPESEWRDDLELGAAELAIALQSGDPLPEGLAHTQPGYYLQQAAQWAGAYVEHNPEGGEGLNLYDTSGLADYELARAMRQGGATHGLALSEEQLTAALRTKLRAATAQAASDPFGFGFGWDQSDTVSHGDGLAVMAAEYDNLTGSRAYAPYAERWLGNVLGANAWGSSFIVGDGSTFPHCLQHQVANIVGSLDGEAPILAGAVVEGPTDEPSKGSLAGMRPCPAEGGNAFARFDNAAIYKDNVQSYTTTEPAIDLTASSMLAFSWQIAQPAPLPGALAMQARLAPPWPG